MREIKFRGLDKKGKWHFGGIREGWMYDYNHMPEITIYIVKSYSDEELVNVETVGQYTGLKDKNGKEIYEGDIIEFNDCSYDRTGGYMDDQILRLSVRFENGAYWAGGFLLIDVIENDEETEILGNICENPELLEKSS